MTIALQCHELRKRYDSGKQVVDAVNGLDLSVQAGECFGLLGPNGAGKTTTVEIMEGLLSPTAGTVSIFDKTWGTGVDNAIRQQIGITLQETKLQDKLTVLETLQLFRSFYTDGMAPEDAMAMLALEEKSSSWVMKLSGGQKQRLAVACALVGRPDLLFLDEPTTGLDPQVRRKLWDVIRNLKASGTTIILTTHYMDEAEKLCDRVAIIDRGKIIALDSPRGLIAALGGEHIIEFSTQALEDGSIDADEALAAYGTLPSVRKAAKETAGILLTVGEPHVAIPALLERLRSEGSELTSLTTRHANLEDVFVSMTGRHLSDE